jgi:hypothetical protein
MRNQCVRHRSCIIKLSDHQPASVGARIGNGSGGRGGQLGLACRGAHLGDGTVHDAFENWIVLPKLANERLRRRRRLVELPQILVVFREDARLVSSLVTTYEALSVGIERVHRRFNSRGRRRRRRGRQDRGEAVRCRLALLCDSLCEYARRAILGERGVSVLALEVETAAKESRCGKRCTRFSQVVIWGWVLRWRRRARRNRPVADSSLKRWRGRRRSRRGH